MARRKSRRPEPAAGGPLRRTGTGRGRDRARRALPLTIATRALALLVLATGGCVPSLPLDGAPCPCAAGYRCCPIEDRCIPSSETCPVSKNCPLPPSAPSLLQLGATDAQAGFPNFRPLPQGGHLPLLRGPQGGYHVFVQVRLLGVDPAGLTLERALFDPADARREHPLRSQVGTPPLYCDRDEAFLLLDEQLTYVCPTQTGARMSERDLVLRLRLSDRAGRALDGEWTLHPDCPPGDNVCLSDSNVGCAARP